MSETTAPSLKGPTTRTALVVSHGQPSDPDPAEAALAELTARVAILMPGWTLASATLAAAGALERAAAIAGPDALVYPLFMTDGWFTRTTLPKRLGTDKARILPPLGTDPALPAVAQHCLQQELADRNWQPRETCLIIASHGSGKSRNSARDTREFTTALSRLITFSDIRIGYIEEPPFIGDVARDTGKQAVCLPFFAAAGGHVSQDIPAALDQAGFQGLRLAPIGSHPDIPSLIATALLTKARDMSAT